MKTMNSAEGEGKQAERKDDQHGLSGGPIEQEYGEKVLEESKGMQTYHYRRGGSSRSACNQGHTCRT